VITVLVIVELCAVLLVGASWATVELTPAGVVLAVVLAAAGIVLVKVA